MLLLLILFPIINILLSGLIGRYLGILGSQIFTIIILIGSLNILLWLIWEIYLNQEFLFINLTNLLNLNYIISNWSIEINQLSISLLIPVIIISFCVHLYSIYYIEKDPHLQRFLAYLSIFTFSIIILVVSEDLLQLFFGWELIGVSSFLLISYWFTRIESSLNAIKAFIINRLGDIFLSIIIYILFATFNSLNFSSILSLNTDLNIGYFLGILILLSSIAKSAQIGFNTWLPDAISGPTPVSALIHAATLVTAGVFLLIRFNILINNDIFFLVSLIGGFTAVFAGTLGILENDLKRVIAFSTCSQIGYLFLSIGIGLTNFSVFHIINHAFFKALLFLSAGIIIHAINENQDLRKIGGLRFYIPIIYIFFIIASLSLIAIPFFSGFYSKELIIEGSYIQFTIQGFFIYILAVLAAILTAYYSIRIFKITFFNKSNINLYGYINIHQPNLGIILPLIFLFIFSILLGYILKDIYSGLGSFFLSTIINSHSLISEIEFNISLIIKFFPLLLTLLGAYFGFKYPILSFNNIQLYKFFSAKWIFDNFINFIGYQLLNFGFFISKIFDKGIIEYLGPYGISSLFINISNYIKSGNVAYYAFIFLFNFSLILLFC